MAVGCPLFGGAVCRTVIRQIYDPQLDPFFAVEPLPWHLCAALAASNPSKHGCGSLVRIVGLILLAGITGVVPAHRSHAQSGATAVAQRLSLTPKATRAPLLPFTWPLRFGDRTDLGSVPLYASIEDFLRRTRDDARGWSASGDPAKWFPATNTGYRTNKSATPVGDSAASDEKHNSLAERRPDLPEGATGDDNVIRFVHYRLPWLVTPESAIHAMPTVSVRSGESVSFEVMGGVIGGRSGAYGQLVLRF